ncbi:hypothetical protein [Roseinatronobacter alkalisoli]|uniref:Uncharacterized protein n=1 Tax=Roseinatronobacter alkalisoli TaxID=3028235 RepID=A0ABT5TH26_9RHOB|nr:hypothetical protein [Roseinatronobacter sp. HJB301]MDD7973666.1 hypothetical protein [Roseinatronobacter sp. HJB301]
MAQEDQAHDGNEVFVVGEVRIGARGVCRTPEAFLGIADLLGVDDVTAPTGRIRTLAGR